MARPVRAPSKATPTSARRRAPLARRVKRRKVELRHLVFRAATWRAARVAKFARVGALKGVDPATNRYGARSSSAGRGQGCTRAQLVGRTRSRLHARAHAMAANVGDAWRIELRRPRHASKNFASVCVSSTLNLNFNQCFYQMYANFRVYLGAAEFALLSLEMFASHKYEGGKREQHDNQKLAIDRRASPFATIAA